MSAAAEFDLSSLALGYWDEPLECEPAHGHVIRCLSLNGQTRTASAAFQLDINGRNLKPDQCLNVMLRHPMEHSELLVLNTPVVGRSVQLRGHEFSSKDWSLRYRRFCPGCLGESAHHRNWWDFRFINRCPYHGCLIDGGLGSSRQVRWSATDLAWADGELLADAHVRRSADMPLTIESYLLGRLGIMPCSAATAVDDYPLRTIVEAARALGKLVVGGWTARPISVGHRAGQLDPSSVYAAGFAALAQPEALRSALQAIAAKCPLTSPESRAEVGVSGMFGWGFKVLRDRLANPLLRSVTETMIDIAAEDGRVRRHPVIVAGRSGAFGRYTMKEAAEELGFSRPALSALTARVLPGFAEARKTLRVHLSAADLAAIREARTTAMTRRELARFLGLETKDIAALEQEQLITPCDMVRAGKAGGRFLLREAQSLISRAISSAGAGKAPAAEVSFRAYDKLRGLSSGRLALEILRRTVLPVRYLGEHGFAGLTFAVEGAVTASVSYDRRRARLANDGLLFTETAVRLGVTHDTVTELVRLGHLRIVGSEFTGTGRDRIDVLSVEEFDRVFVAAKSLASVLGCRPNGATKRLLNSGVPLELEPGPKRRFTAIVRRSDVGSLEGVKREQSERSALLQYWDHFRGEMRVRCAWIQVPPSPPEPTASLWNSARSLHVGLTVNENSLSLSVECDAIKSSRRLSLFLERRHLLSQFPSVSVLSRGAGVSLLAKYKCSDIGCRDNWAGSIEWVSNHLTVFQEMFLPRLRKNEVP